MSPHRIHLIFSLILIVSLTACGAGGAGNAGASSGLVLSAPPPPVPPAPPPPPTSSVPPPFGLTQMRDFSTVGISDSFTTGARGTVEGNLVPDLTAAVQFRYLADEQAYEAVLPGLAPGRLESPGPHSSRDNFLTANLRNANIPGTQQAVVSLYTPGAQNSELALTYTSFGIWGSNNAGQPGPHTGGIFAYGVPTAAGDVPSAGTGSYDAVVEGVTADGGIGIHGQAQLVFDFDAGSLKGSMQPTYGDFSAWDYGTLPSLGRYDFTQTVYSAGSTNFSGRFIVPGGGSTADSFFEGRFTGPQAAELMARWLAPYVNPDTHQWSTMFGIWAGKKH